MLLPRKLEPVRKCSPVGRAVSSSFPLRLRSRSQMERGNSRSTFLTARTCRTARTAPAPLTAVEGGFRPMSWPGLEIDALGDLGAVTIDSTLYTEQAVFRAAYWLTDRHYVFLDKEG